jgi:predicted O-linked N-acetylglucosamine transferase (SPINDLY family)
MSRNRLLVFARKPAPVQVSYLAYAGTTGLKAMDYRLRDPYLDPVDCPTFGSERVIRLAETYWCYVPQIQMPEPGPRPAGPIVFACYNNCAKVNRLTIALWSEILRQLPDSRLRLTVFGGESGNEHLKKSFEQHGIDPARIEWLDKVNYSSYFPLYDPAHVALDPFPYNGGTTTIDALYMGVPVISLAGTNGMARAGVSILTNVGLPELIAPTPEAYVAKAVALARDRVRLNDLSATLRQRVKDSPLMNAPAFVRNLETAYRAMWNETQTQ